MERKTPLYDCHVACGGKLVPFAGYLLPVQYRGVIEEHMAVRERAGLFDVSHMGEVLLTGPDALQNLNHLFTNDFTNMTDGRVRYSPMCNEQGGIVDDLVVCRIDAQQYLIVVNAANREKDVEHMRKVIFGDVQLQDVSDSYAQLALQGPKSREILAKLTAQENIPEKYYTFVKDRDVAGISCIVSRTGYTGEMGFELYCAPQEAAALWNALLEAGAQYGLIPCGLGARDTLRLEAGMPLYGHEMDDAITPFEAGLAFAVKMGKMDFVGKRALEEKSMPQRGRIGLHITGRGIAREKQTVFANGEVIGETTSGTHCPYLGGAYAMALVETAFAMPGIEVEVDVRGRRIAAQTVALPFYSRTK